MTIAAYVRTPSPDDKKDARRAEIQKWMTANKIDKKQVTWYIDPDNNSVLDEYQQPNFDAMQANIASGKVKTVIIPQLDKVCRRFHDGIEILADWAGRGLKVVIVSQNLQFDSQVGQTLSTLLTELASLEKQFRKDRQQAGIEAAREKGVYQGRKRGSTKGKPERVRNLRSKGKTTSEIAKILGISERTVFRYISKDKAKEAEKTA